MSTKKLLKREKFKRKNANTMFTTLYRDLVNDEENEDREALKEKI